MFDGLKYVWIKVINNKDVDTFEFMSAMGSSSQNLILYCTKSNNTYKPLIFTISKIDGSIVLAFDLINLGNIIPPSK